MNGRVLVINASFEPLALVPLKRAVLLVLQEKAEIVHEGEGEFRSARMSIPVPTVVRLRYYVRVPYRRKQPMSRIGIFRRDDFKCQYCGKQESAANLTLDHVHPRSKGGKHTWENVVSCCRLHNKLKADKTLDQLGPSWKLLRKPYAPTGTQWLVLGIAEPDPAWGTYLGLEPTEVAIA